MPRSKVNAVTSNLSVAIPRSVHKEAKVAYLRSGAKVSFAAYVAWCLKQAPAVESTDQRLSLQLMELKTKCCMPKKEDS